MWGRLIWKFGRANCRTGSHPLNQGHTRQRHGQSVQIASGIGAGALIAVNGGGDGVEEADPVQPVVTQASQIERRTGESSPTRTK